MSMNFFSMSHNPVGRKDMDLYLVRKYFADRPMTDKAVLAAFKRLIPALNEKVNNGGVGVRGYDPDDVNQEFSNQET